MRTTLALILIAGLSAGCGDEAPPPDVATSEQLVRSAVLEYHRLQAAGDAKGACDMVTETTRKAVVKQGATLAKALGQGPADSCAEALALQLVPQSREMLGRTEVEAVRVEGERAWVTAHTRAELNGVLQPTPATDIALRWSDGRWLIG